MLNNLFWFATFIDVVAAVAIFISMDTDHARRYGKLNQIGRWTLSFGLLAQAGRNVEFLITGVSPTDADLPLWFLKDLGVFLIVAYVLISKFKELKEKK